MTGFVKSFHLVNFIIYFHKTNPHTYPPPLKNVKSFTRPEFSVPGGGLAGIGRGICYKSLKMREEWGA